MNRLLLDHLVVTGPSLEAAVEHVETSLGVQMVPGGRHAAMGTWNRLMSLGDGVYLEAIAVDPDAPAPDHARWFGLDRPGPPRLAGWVVRGGATGAVPEAAGVPVALSRGAFSWTLTVREDGAFPCDGAMPAHIVWTTGGHPAERLPASGCWLNRLEVTHPDAPGLMSEWQELLTLSQVRFGPGPATSLRAEIMTPKGMRFLE